MNEVMIFSNPEFGQVRTTTIDDKVYFMANDVAKSLGYLNPSKATNDHCKRSQMIWGNDSLGRSQQFKVIPIGDVYRLAARSKLPGAEKFESWIFDEVVPSVLQTGSYNATTEQIPYESYLQAAKLIRGCKNKEERNLIIGILRNGGFDIPVVDVVSVDTKKLDKVEFSKEFKNFLKDNGYSYKKFSELSGLPKSSISNYATGTTIADEKNMKILKQCGFRKEIIQEEVVNELDYESFVVLCERYGITPHHASLEIGIGAELVSRWKHGKRKPTPKHQQLIIEFFQKVESNPELLNKVVQGRTKLDRVTPEWVKMVKHKLIDRDMTIGDLAKAVGHGQSQISDMFGGNRPYVELRQKINEYLEINE